MALARLINNPIFFLQMKDKQIFFRFLKENNAYMAWLRNFKRVSHALKQNEAEKLSLLFRDDRTIRQVVRNSFSWFATQEGYWFWFKLNMKWQKYLLSISNENRIKYVQRTFLKCRYPITNVRKGSGCEVGQTYWFEYVEDNQEGINFYRKLSNNNHNDEVYITDDELVENFEVIATW